MSQRIHQPMANRGLRPLFKWARFLIYIFIVFLLCYTFTILKPSNTSFNNQTPQQEQQQQKDSVDNNDNDDQAIKTFTPLYRDFPWYKDIHPRVVMFANISTTHFTTAQRIKLQESKVDQAKKQAKTFFSQIQPPIMIPVPGSNSIRTTEAADSLRARLQCWTRGQWIPSSSPIPRNKLIRHVQDPLYSSCDKRFYKSHATSIPRPETQYRWELSGGGGECSRMVLPKPTPQQWCQVLNGRHILVVGDLVQYQLHELFLDSLRDGPTVCFGELNCKDHTICSDMDTRLRYLRNDILADNRQHDNNNGSPSGSIVTWPFVASNILKAYPIIILNRSPIVEDDDTFITSLIHTMAYIRRTAPDILIIYRSSGIGHPHCDDADGPLTKPLKDGERKRLPFGWAELERRNAIARVIVEEAGGVFVDLAALSDTRPDGHVGGHDCLRYCIPGPLDTWMDILYQVLASLG
ncbi:hypothetical protein BC941DRAFT_417723 [Chlamydoabsidia padenii]|nr:hypothetical protein BC941DRAFT_417723 [Chlamydoabsidia padenii]